MAKLLKLGGGGLPRVEPDTSKPPPVANHYDNSMRNSGELSERCQWWLRMIERGWLPNRHTLRCCWDCNSEWLGVYGWEYTDVICVALKNGRLAAFDRAEEERRKAAPPILPPLDDRLFVELQIEFVEGLNEEVLRSILYGDGSSSQGERR